MAYFCVLYVVGTSLFKSYMDFKSNLPVTLLPFFFSIVCDRKIGF